MNRTLQILNFIGVFALAILCGIQWRANVNLHENMTAAQTTLAEESAKITEQQTALKGATADLEEFRARVAAAEQLAKDTQSKLDQTTTERDAALTERDQWKATVDSLKAALNQWTAAVATRDQALKQANDLAQKLAADRNEAITKYNDLVKQYNAAAAEITEAASRIKQLAADRDAAIQKFNDLAVKYNVLITGSPPTQPTPKSH